MAGTRWQRWARQAVEDDLLAVRRELTEKALELAGDRPIDEAVEGFLATRAERVARVQRFIRALAVEGVSDLAQLTVALRQLRSLLA